MEIIAWVVDPITQVELPVPSYASPKGVIEREALKRSGRLRAIRFFPDWGYEWPLWEVGVDANPATLGLSEELRTSLRRWYDVWAAGFRYDKGWDSVEAANDWISDGDKLADRLQQEVWDFAEVTPSHHSYSKVSG